SPEPGAKVRQGDAAPASGGLAAAGGTQHEDAFHGLADGQRIAARPLEQRRRQRPAPLTYLSRTASEREQFVQHESFFSDDEPDEGYLPLLLRESRSRLSPEASNDFGEVGRVDRTQTPHQRVQRRQLQRLQRDRREPSSQLHLEPPVPVPAPARA